MKMRMFSMLLALCLLLSTGVLAASPEAVTGSAQALETGMELTLVLHTATTNGKIAVSYPAELELWRPKPASAMRSCGTSIRLSRASSPGLDQRQGRPR